MGLDLAVQLMPQQSTLGLVDRDAGFVAGRFDSKNNHWILLTFGFIPLRRYNYPLLFGPGSSGTTTH